jgi:nucleoside-diphosphate-sugar epimerase
MSTAHVDNVCHAVELAIEKGHGGEAYFVSDGVDSTLKQVISGLLETRGIESPQASAPLTVAWVMASVMEWMWRTFSRQGEPPITRQMLRLIGKPFTLDISKAQRELSYRPVVSWEQGIKAMLSVHTAVLHRQGILYRQQQPIGKSR